MIFDWYEIGKSERLHHEEYDPPTHSWRARRLYLAGYNLEPHPEQEDIDLHVQDV